MLSKNLIALLCISIILLSTTYLISSRTSIQDEIQFEDSEIDLQQANALKFRSSVNCDLGSQFKFAGTSCDQTVFNNIYDALNKKEFNSISNQKVAALTVTTASEIQTYVNHKVNQGGGGFFSSYRRDYEYLDKLFEFVSTVNLILTDFRTHKYVSIPTNSLTVDEVNLQDFIDDPDYFFLKFGFYFVKGYTTASSFDGVYSYYSKNHDALTEVKEKIVEKRNYIFFSSTKTREFHDLKTNKYDIVQEIPKFNYTGCTEMVFDANDLSGSYDKYQNSISQEQMYTVTVARYVDQKQFMDAVKQMSPENQNKIKKYKTLSPTFFNKISIAYGTYIFLIENIDQHIKKGSQAIGQLQTLKQQIENRKYQIEGLDNIDAIVELYQQRSPLILQYENMSIEVAKLMKQID